MLLIKNANIVNEGKIFTGSVLIDQGRISEIFEASTPMPESFNNVKTMEYIDATGLFLLPGVIDDHVHFREPGLTHKADIAGESAAAAAGGVTSVLDMPNVKPQTTSAEALQQKQQLYADKSLVNWGLFFGITTDNIAEALTLPAQDFCGYKIFLGSSTGNMLMNDSNLLRKLFMSTQRVIAVHSESESIIRQNMETYKTIYGNEVPILCHPLIRSAEACYRATSEVVALARETKAHLHVCHLTTARELELFDEGNIEGKHITAEACVAHLWFTDADYTQLGARIKCNPAIKTSADRDALRAALNDDRIDIIATDHAPHTWEEKQGNALTAMSGMPSIQYSLLAMLELQSQKVCSLPMVVQKMCHAPALLYGMEQRGFIRPGYHADLVLVDPNKTTTVTPRTILSKCGWSPFEGTTFNHAIVGTWVNGQRVYDHGFIDDKVRGQKISYNV